jgi:hypothetical protein
MKTHKIARVLKSKPLLEGAGVQFKRASGSVRFPGFPFFSRQIVPPKEDMD